MKTLLKFIFKREINKYLDHSCKGFNIYFISQHNNWTLDYTRAIGRLIKYLNSN